MEKMENMENPKKLAVATIAGLTEVAGMAAPAMADETAADPMVGQTQSADPTKDALDKANTAVSESQTAYDNAQQNVQDAQSKVDDAYASDPATNAAQSELDAAQAALAEVNATLKTAETALATAKSDAESAQDAYDKAHKVVTPSKDTTITVDTPDSADSANSANRANRAAVKTSTQAKLGDTGVDVMETAVFTIMAAGTAGATLMLKRRGDGRYGLMARHAK